MNVLFAFRLAWRQLTFERGKLTAAILGVLFACVLVFMQLGFRDSLMDSATTVPRALRADLVLLHKQTEALWRTIPFSRRELLRTLGHPQVESIVPVYIGQTAWKNPETQTKRTLMVFGFEPSSGVFYPEQIGPFAKDLTIENTVLFDSLSRPEFGPIAELLKHGPLTTELNDRTASVAGTFRMGASFAADGNLVTSDQNFLRFFPQRHQDQIDLGVVRLRPGANIQQVQAELSQWIDEDIYVFSYSDMVAFEHAYWQNNAPIGFIFGFGTIMGLVVGMVIVYQILFTDITNHVNEYATLKAMGYSHGYLLWVVFAASLYLALLGFIPGATLSALLYHMAESVTYIPMPMGLAKLTNVFLMILTMCVMAGSLAMRKLKSANPADMF